MLDILVRTKKKKKKIPEEIKWNSKEREKHATHSHIVFCRYLHSIKSAVENRRFTIYLINIDQNC